MQRSEPLKPIIIFVCLLALMASQGRLLFACDVMGGEPKLVCCCGGDMSEGCENGGGCPMPEAFVSAGACCTISMDMPSEVAMASPAGAFDVCLLQAPQPPPAPFTASVVDLSLRQLIRIPLSIAPSLPPDSERLYLLTRRIRI